MADMTFKANLLPYDSTKELGKSNDNNKWWKLYSSGISSNGHINLTGSHASSSTANTSQIIFGTYASDYSTEHVALSSNNKALVINPNHGQTTNQIVLYLDKASVFPKGINGNASTATKLQTARNIQTNLESTSAASFDGSGNITPGISGTLSVNHGGTGAATFTSGAALIGNGTGAIQTRTIKNNTAVGNLGWTSASADTALITTNTVAYWNGAYANTSSNLQYSKNGEIMGLDSAQTVSGTKTFSAIQKFTNTTDSGHSKDTAAALSTSGGISVEKQVSAKSIRIDNNQTSAGVQLIFDNTLQALNFVFI